MFLPCVCEIDHTYKSDEPFDINPCDMVFYHPQDIKKGERLATAMGYEEFVLAYKICDFCTLHR